MTENQNLLSLAEKIQDKKSNIMNYHYTPLQLASPDAYIPFEGSDGQKIFRGKVWSQKTISQNGMVEMILMQEANTPKNWYPFLFRSSDQTATAASLFDQIPKESVERSNRLSKLTNFVSWVLIVILLYLLISEVQIDLTITFFMMVLGFTLAITLTFFYERKRIQDETIDTATFYQDAPALAISRSFIHPYSGEIMRFAGEVIPIQMKTSRISFQKIRGFSVSQIEKELSYAQDMREFKVKYYANELRNPERMNGQLTQAERDQLTESYLSEKTKLDQFKISLIQKHKGLIDTNFHELITTLNSELSNLALKEKIAAEIVFREQEFEQLHALKTQAEIERDKAKQDAQSWMQKANSDLARNDVIVAAKLAKLVRDGALVDSYNPSSLNQTKSSIPGISPALISSLISFVPFVILFILGMSIWNMIQDSLAKLGAWGSFLYIIIMTFVMIAASIFVFQYSKARIVDSMKNQNSSKKMVMT